LSRVQDPGHAFGFSGSPPRRCGNLGSEECEIIGAATPLAS
jgi:hypothetical protein